MAGLLFSLRKKRGFTFIVDPSFFTPHCGSLLAVINVQYCSGETTAHRRNSAFEKLHKMINSGNRLSRREMNCRNSRNEGEMRKVLPGGFDKADAHALRGEWNCTDCSNTCLVIREECRCLCGHRLKEHTDVRKKIRNEKEADKSKQRVCSYKCVHPKCKCNHFFYIVGEGAWILRCRCKHKHTEHDPVSFKCARASCTCAKFDSPWVCNCNHPWSAHVQRMCAERRLEGAKFQLENFSQIIQEVNNLQTLRRDPSNVVNSDKTLTVSHSYNKQTNTTTAPSQSRTFEEESSVLTP